MCPACMASAALTASGVITTGGLTALVGKIFYTARSAKTDGFEQSSVVSRRSSAKQKPSITNLDDCNNRRQTNTK